MKIIDLSVTIAPSPETTPDFLQTKIEYSDHSAGAVQAEALLGVPKKLFRNEEGWAVETITRLGTHDSTHLDAPYHYNSTINGEPAMTVDELPLEWFFNDGVCLDMTKKEEGQPISTSEVIDELERIHYALKPLDIVLIHTGRDRFYGDGDYVFKGCGVTPEATKWFYEKGIRVMGIDAWGWDPPLNIQAQLAIEKNAAGIFWAAHQVDLQYVHMERMVNLGALPASGFKVSCFPLKIKNGSAGPCRAVAIMQQ